MTEQNDTFDYSENEGRNRYIILKNGDVLIACFYGEVSQNFPIAFDGEGCLFSHYTDQGFVEIKIGKKACSAGGEYYHICADSYSDAVRKAKRLIEERITELEEELFLLRGCQGPSLSIRPFP